MDRIDFLGLEAFLGVANWGTFSRAAASLHLSQAALSHRLKKLEDELGVKLFVRTTRTVALSPAGVQLLPVAQRVVNDLAATFADLRMQARDTRESIRIGCVPTIAIHHLPLILKDFATSHPNASVRIIDNSATEIVERVRSGDVEFGITIVSAKQFDLDIAPIYKEPFVLVCSAFHELAMKQTVSWSQLDEVPLIKVGGQTGNSVLIDEVLGGRFQNLRWKYEVNRIATAIGMVVGGIGMTIVPRLAFEAAKGQNIVAIPIRNPSIVRTISIVTKKGRAISPLADALSKVLKAHFGGL